MRLREYENFVTGRISKKSMASFESRMGLAGLGLGGEGGECADLAKKVLFHELPFDEETREKLLKELGDVMFYVAFAAKHLLGTNVQGVIDANVKKLKARYKKTFTVEEFMVKERGKKIPRKKV